MKLHKPRVLFVGLGDTDELAHARQYDLYLDAAHRADAYLKELWDTVQGMKEYRGKTALIFSPDHGRGEGPEWKSHGEKVPGLEIHLDVFPRPRYAGRSASARTSPA